MAPKEQFFCTCFQCTDGSRKAPKKVARTTLYEHRHREKRPRLDSGGRGGGCGGPADDGGQPSAGGSASGMGASGGAGSEDGLVSVSGAVAPTGVATGDRRCDAEDIPEQSETSSPDEDSNESGDEPPPEFIVDSGLEQDFGPPPTPAIQPDVRKNEVRLSVSQFKDCKADLEL